MKFNRAPTTQTAGKRQGADKLGGMTRQEFLKLPAHERLKIIGHRRYVGGTNAAMWFGMGRRQFQYLASVGLEPHHRFLDVACGSLRLGQFLIPYLAKGNYMGLEGEKALVQAGLKHELLYGLGEIKLPRFAYNYDFDVSSLGQFDYAMAQSLFTHLTLEDIQKCFAKLAPFANEHTKFYTTYFEGEPLVGQNELGKSHAQKSWRYAFDDLAAAADRGGWKMTRIGDWGHPRKQMMTVSMRA